MQEKARRKTNCEMICFSPYMSILNQFSVCNFYDVGINCCPILVGMKLTSAPVSTNIGIREFCHGCGIDNIFPPATYVVTTGWRIGFPGIYYRSGP